MQGRGMKMNAATFQYINDLADQVILEYDISIPILDIDSVVQRIGGTVLEKADLDILYNGRVRKDGVASFCIEVSPYLSPRRRTFTIAHELGHLFLHMGYRTNWARWQKQGEPVYRRFGTSAQEDQASEFAAALLMPRDQLGEAIVKYTHGDSVDMTEVAKCLNVSPAAAINRGRLLGYL